jgi:hypothetical protein
MNMARSKLLRPVLLVAFVGTLALALGGGANAALVKVGTLVLRADGSFKPTHLPRGTYAPIDLSGRADITLTTGGPPPALQEVNLDFDRDGRLSTQGLPRCSIDRIRTATTRQARSICRNAIIGEGFVGAWFRDGETRVKGTAPATLFNGPRLNGDLSAIGHVFTDFPSPRTYAVLIPIEKTRGQYAYHAHLDIPQIADDGVLTHIDGKISRRYRYRGKERSYVSARCTAGVLRVHGHFQFSNPDATIIDGSIEKPCYPESR